MASTGALAPRTSAARSEDRELAFLTFAADGHQPFVQHATARLAAGQELFGDAWADRPVAALLGELLEEAADLGAWAALALQLLDDEPAADRERCATVLTQVAGHGADAHAALLEELGAGARAHRTENT